MSEDEAPRMITVRHLQSHGWEWRGPITGQSYLLPPVYNCETVPIDERDLPHLLAIRRGCCGRTPKPIAEVVG